MYINDFHLAAIEKKRKAEAAANRSAQGWGISNWWYGNDPSAGTPNVSGVYICLRID